MFFYWIIATSILINVSTAELIAHVNYEIIEDHEFFENREQIKNEEEQTEVHEQIEDSEEISDSRIIGGWESDIKHFPYQVSVQFRGKHTCGGSIISAYYILTAGHCIGSNPADITVRSGSTWREYGGTVHQVRQIIHHEYFNRYNNRPVNDIALLLLYRPLRFDETRQPIRLFNDREQSPDGARAIVTGWGITATGNLSDRLQYTFLPILGKYRCNNIYRYISELIGREICTAIVDRTIFKGDSGGALVIDGRQTGIVSWMAQNYPAVYVEIASYRDWIRRHTNI